MQKKVRSIDVRTADGTPIVQLYISEQDVALGEVPNRSQAPNRQAKNSAAQTNSQTANDSPMTDAQKRYLFRILAEQGLEADAAHKRLKEMFQVESLQEVSKLEASRMIENLLEEAESR